MCDESLLAKVYERNSSNHKDPWTTIHFQGSEFVQYLSLDSMLIVPAQTEVELQRCFESSTLAVIWNNVRTSIKLVLACHSLQVHGALSATCQTKCCFAMPWQSTQGCDCLHYCVRLSLCSYAVFRFCNMHTMVRCNSCAVKLRPQSGSVLKDSSKTKKKSGL